jgi:hypothetical protein
VIAVARYLLAEHLRSRRFVAPLLLLASGVVVLYAQPPNPVLSTAGTVAAYTFPCMCWAALALLNTQGDADRHVLLVAAGPRAFIVGRLLALAAFSAVISVLVVAFPVVTGRFEATPTLAELADCLAATVLCALAGAGLGALFSRPLVRSRTIAVFGLALTALVTVPLNGPPAITTAQALDITDASDVPARLSGTLASVSLFALAVAVTCALLWRRRE